MLGRKKETQDLPNVGHPYLKMHEDAPLGWGVRLSAKCVTSRMVQLYPPELPGLFQGVAGLERAGPLHHAQKNTSPPPTIVHPPNFTAQRSQEHSHKLRKLRHQAPHTVTPAVLLELPAQLSRADSKHLPGHLTILILFMSKSFLKTSAKVLITFLL